MITLFLTLALVADVDCVNGRCTPARPTAPHPAVVRVINQHGGSRSLGSGTLVAVEADYALVATCAHLFGEGVGTISVEFPQGDRYAAQVAALDAANDLAVLRLPQVAAKPVPLAEHPPRAGDWLASCGYGSVGNYAVNRGRALGYASLDGRTFDVLEMAGAARRGDSGGPIFNDRGELAGVLFGTDGRSVNGSHCGKLRTLLQRCVPPQPATRPPAAPQSPACQCDPRLAEKLANLEREIAKLASLAGALPRVPEGAAPAGEGSVPPTSPAPPPRLLERLLPHLATWGPWLAGLGIPGSLAAGVTWWLWRRVRPQQRSATTTPIATTIGELPPRQREFVELRVPTSRLAALEQAMDEYVRRNPGARPTIETIEAYALQYEAASK